MLKRLYIYLSEMYPLTSWVGTFLSGFMVLTVAWRMGTTTVPFELNTLWACLALCFFSLLLRIMDEFKDYQDDLKNFPNRPLPSGKVLKSDLKFLGWFCVVAGLACSAWNEDVFYLALGVMFYSFLMLKWFYHEQKIRSSLPLALITHHPIVLFHFFYLLAVAQTTTYAEHISTLWVILPLVAMMTNWEIARKIRAPENETKYTTYSKIWGPRKAIILSLVLQLIVAVTAIYLFHQMKVSFLWAVGFGVIYITLMLPSINFLLTYKTKQPLKSWAEAEILAVVVTLLAAGWLG